MVCRHVKTYAVHQLDDVKLNAFRKLCSASFGMNFISSPKLDKLVRQDQT